ncbi:hypothetical protein BS329_35855 [Amycolatopsis coloradensis]|uniref:Guanylate cyclase domain-containing protein n=1 Tax=Amycolatopsis coloradensis TaxID=76021 RepID=A0A1R0KGF7_9PSEU|nr:hypothetical protein [Amycolatopsis coloradensis]OLZ44683.1 hypothetical protein BS329_35855 [Amycolatopsis coloradensis]
MIDSAGLIVVVDVEGFGDRSRTGPDQRAVREGLYKVMEMAFAASGAVWKNCYREDRGDGLFLLAPGGVDKAAFIESVLPALVTRLRIHNATHPDVQRIRLRIALHAGEIYYDEHGCHVVDDAGVPAVRRSAVKGCARRLAGGVVGDRV